MVFSSLTFLLGFLPVTLALYYAVPQKAKNFILLLCSLVFYAWGEPVYVFLMIYSILFNYTLGRLMDKYKVYKRMVMIFAVLMNLIILGFFKYYGFIVNALNSIMGLSLKARDIPLPIGISFYTFQAMSYIIDLYRGKFGAQKNLITFAAYITMFPQLIAGPIVRYEDLQSELEERRLSLERFGYGCARFLYGLAKKVLLANSTGAVFESVGALDGSGIAAANGWIGAVSYTFQIYFDFSGYSDMAIGLGSMLGFSFDENFNEPYTAVGVSDFWRRWHISLGAWFREYVYIPLGGSRVRVWKHIRNIMVVWTLTGLWHGAGWNYILWGAYYGILLIIDKYLIERIKLFPKWLKRIFTIPAVIIGWVIFTSDSPHGAMSAIGSMFGSTGVWFNDETFYLLRTNGILLVICAILCTGVHKRIYDKVCTLSAGRAVTIAFNAALLALCFVCLVTQSYNPFLYFQF
ncbi:MAG: MBOAT family protein [Butyrivibrio sp.]|nr:MBOAT family protein [Butyrivibrio sp.]